jgi:retron-type reverse transcriptase
VILRKPNKPETLARSYRPITLLNCLDKVLEKVVQRRLASLTTDTIPKQQFGGRNGFSTADALAKMISYAETNQRWNRVTSILAIDIKGAFDNVHRGALLKTMSDTDLPEASRCWVNYFLSRRKISLIIDGKKTEPRYVDSGIPQGSPISPLLFLIYRSSLYNKIREAGAHVVGFIDDITIYKGGRDIDKNTATLSRMLQICHEWAQ